LACAPRTVSKHFDSGRLQGYRIPGSQDRRIPRKHFLGFLLENGRPLSALEEVGCKLRVMCVSNDAEVAKGMEAKDEFAVTSYATVQIATQMLDAEFPMLVVLDYVSIPDAEEFRTWLAEGPWKGIVSVIGVSRAGVTEHGTLDAFYEVPDWNVVKAKAKDLMTGRYIRS
jgi:hypothetical protein